MSELAAVGLTCPRCAPVAYAGALGGAAGGDEARLRSVPGRFGARAASPWQPTHPAAADWAFPSMCAPEATTMFPWGSTVWGWQELHAAAVTGPARAGCPAGGMPWQDVQVGGEESLQVGLAREPLMAPKVKAPWQYTLLHVRVTGSNVPPWARTRGSCEKSTVNPVGAWQSAQVEGTERVSPRRWTAWPVPEGPGSLGVEPAQAVTARVRAIAPG
jgi:hypothetical protein